MANLYLMPCLNVFIDSTCVVVAVKQTIELKTVQPPHPPSLSVSVSFIHRQSITLFHFKQRQNFRGAPMTPVMYSGHTVSKNGCMKLSEMWSLLRKWFQLHLTITFSQEYPSKIQTRRWTRTCFCATAKRKPLGYLDCQLSRGQRAPLPPVKEHLNQYIYYLC